MKTFEAYSIDYLTDRLISHLKINEYTPVEINELVPYYSIEISKLKEQGFTDGIILSEIIASLPKTKNRNKNKLNMGNGSVDNINYL